MRCHDPILRIGLQECGTAEAKKLGFKLVSQSGVQPACCMFPRKDARLTCLYLV